MVRDDTHPLSQGLQVSRGRWERRHVALFRADLEVDTDRGEPSDPRGLIDLIIARIQSFGGRVEELGFTTVVAAFGVEPTEDAPSRASLAALAVLKDWEREQTAGTSGCVTVAVHVYPAMIRQVGSIGRLDADAKQAALGNLASSSAAASAARSL